MTEQQQLKSIELTKNYGYARAKGFEKKDGITITRWDCTISFARKNWQVKDVNGVLIGSCPTLFAALKLVH